MACCLPDTVGAWGKLMKGRVLFPSSSQSSGEGTCSGEVSPGQQRRAPGPTGLIGQGRILELTPGVGEVKKSGPGITQARGGGGGGNHVPGQETA